MHVTHRNLDGLLQRLFHLSQRQIYIVRCMGCGNGALLWRQGKYIDSALYQQSTESGIQCEVMIRGEVVPIPRAMVHEIPAERGTLSRNDCGDAERDEYLLQTTLHLF